TVDGTPQQLQEVRQGIIDLSTTGIDGRNAIPQTTAQLTELAAAGGQLGIKTENIVGFTETMAQMGTATNLAGEQGAKTLARFMNVAGVSQDQVGNLGSSIVDLGNNFATMRLK
ncbi:MAG: phage tail tape measure protein, partial [Monoglobus pectinilyticus]